MTLVLLPSPLASLSQEERVVLQLLSVLYAPTPVTGLQAALSSYDSSWTESPRPLLEGLQERGLVRLKASRFSCSPEVVELVTREVARAGLLEAMARAVAAARSAPKPKPSWRASRQPQGPYQSCDEAMRDLRLAAHMKDEARFQELLGEHWRTWLVKCEVHPFEQLLTPFDAGWLEELPPAILDHLVSYIEYSEDELALSWLEHRLLTGDSGSDQARANMAWRAMMDGRLDHAGRLLTSNRAATFAQQGFQEMMRGRPTAAAELYDKALGLLRQESRRKNETFHSEFALFHPLALLACQRLDAAAELIETVSADKKHPLARAHQLWRLALRLKRGELLEVSHLPYPAAGRGVPNLLEAALLVWHDPATARPLAAILEKHHEEARQAGQKWLAAEYAELLARVTGTRGWKEKARALHAECGTKTILDAIERLEPWERILGALEALGRQPEAPPDTRSLRLIWLVSVHEYRGHVGVGLSPREQKLTASGWTGGRAVALKRLYSDWTRLDHLTPADQRLCGCIKAYRTSDRYYNDVDYRMDMDEALPHLVGHPLVFLESTPDVRVEVTAARPMLRVEKAGGGLRLRLDPPRTGQRGIACSWQGTNVLKVIEFSDSERRLGEILGGGCEVPKRGLSRVQDLLADLAGQVTVHSDAMDSTLAQVNADPHVHLHLEPSGEGLQGRAWVRPFGEHGPLHAPGAGGQVVLAEIEGRPLQARRQLAIEKAAWQAVQRACPRLADVSPEDCWELPEPEDCLELLMSLEALAGQVTLHWPQGTPFQVMRRLEWRDLRLNVESEREWFVVGGEVEVDENRVMALQALLQANRRGRFVPLGQGQFLALSSEFARRLEDLRSLSVSQANGQRVHALTAPLLEETIEGASVTVDQKWRQHLEQLTRLEDAPLPSTLQAELRDYQLTGFRWLAQLARWGMGACLADDMGLGKTLQALAVLLLRAAEGPALVVAPTSVCSNWLTEIRRFAPTLRPRLYAGPERELDQPAGFDVLVTSYALLANSEALRTIEWHTVVLDEAQAIKNASTRRSQAAMSLRANFRLATTGTPVENHLGELWNLFRFLNPGLLGTREQFETRYSRPIEAGDPEARRRLKRLVAPFMLRRTKAQVLEELPSRTETTLRIELSETERALYEAIRRSALEALADPTGGAPQRMRTLAELMRLRRACCHPRLVLGAGDHPGTSSKLQAFSELLDELLANRHKALVFSQFVDHLTVVRERLEERGIPHQYLDGSTPLKERQRRVDAFQRGEGEAFLISLRAGGTGLNLTAADYVVHLDPWWNPAVEDQASDRAHRLGQNRPVTIYRLVARDTVEERIVDLHARKRDLAEGLLNGSDARISLEDLRQLLRDESSGPSHSL